MSTPEERLDEAATMAEAATAIATDWANGPDRDVIPEPLSGPLPTIRKFLADKAVEIDENANLIAAFEVALATPDSQKLVGGLTAETISSLLSAITRGLRIKPIYCVLRATTAGDWFALDDSGHIPVGISSITTNSIGQVVINFDESYTKVISLDVSMDETLSSAGFIGGASVALGSASITIGAPCQVRVNLSTGDLVKEAWVTASSTISAAGEITITHADRNSVGVNHSMPSATTYNPSVGAGAPLIDLSWGDSATILTPLVPLAGYVTYNGSSWTVSTEAAGVTVSNISSGVRVTHPICSSVFSSVPVVSSRFGTMIAQQDAFTTTNFDVRFRDFSGAEVPTYNTDMRFNFSKSAIVPSAAPVNGSAIVDLGFLPIDAREFSSSVGNIWVVGYMLDED